MMKQGILQTFLTQIPTLVLYFVANLVMTRLLGEEGRGVYALVYNLGVFTAVLMSLNLYQGVTYWISKDPTRAPKVMGVGIAFFLITALVTPLVIALILLVPAIRSLILPASTPMLTCALFLLLTVLCSHFTGIASGVLLALKRFRTLNRMSILQAALSMVGLLALHLSRHRYPEGTSVEAVLLVSCLTLVIMAGTWAALYRSEVGPFPRPTLDRAVVGPVVRFALAGYAAYLVMLVVLRFDVWVIEHYRTTADVGIYAVAVGLAQVLFYLPEPLARVVQPFLYASGDPTMIARFKVVSRLNFTAVLVLCALLALSAGTLVPILYGEAFRPSVTPLLMLLPGILFMCTSKLLTPLLVHDGGMKYHLWSTTVGASLTVLLDLVLIPRFGALGAAAASSMAYLGMLLTVCHLIRSRYGIRLHDAFILHRNDLAHLKGVLQASRQAATAMVTKADKSKDP